jgi:ABC-type multidrug transport system ATPase subunit
VVHPDPEQETTLEASDITLRYRSSGRGVEGVSLAVRPGEIYGLMGPNGSGKSTLLRVLSTALEPDAGAFHVGGADGIQERRRVRAKTGLMVDRPTHYDDLSGWANAYFFARAYGLAKDKAEAVLAELFDYFDLAEYRDDNVKTYSYGMGKKLALIEALAHGPRLLLLDEPSLGLDYTSQLAYQRKIRDLKESGVAILLGSNQVDEVESLCDRVAFLHRGRLVEEGSPEDLIASIKGVRRIEVTLRNPVEYGAVEKRVPGVVRVVPEGRNLVVHCEDRPGIVADVVAGVVGTGGDITDLAVRRPNLEDVYVKLTGEALRDED